MERSYFVTILQDMEWLDFDEQDSPEDPGDGEALAIGSVWCRTRIRTS